MLLETSARMAGCLVALLALSCIGACRSTDPACIGRNAATEAVGPERYRALSVAERRTEAARFDALARRCGWEP